MYKILVCQTIHSFTLSLNLCIHRFNKQERPFLAISLNDKHFDITRLYKMETPIIWPFYTPFSLSLILFKNKNKGYITTRCLLG